MCGNGVLDEGEQCDFLSQPYTGMTKSGYLNLNKNWDSNPKTNREINIACTQYCTVKTGFTCPLEHQDSLLCVENCHDGLFDGPLDSTIAPLEGSRTLAEECDTGGEPGCDRMCKQESGYIC